MNSPRLKAPHATKHYHSWKLLCGWCGRNSHWATDGRNLFCALCGRS